MDSVKINDARVIQCLQDYKDELQQPACKEQVHVLAKRASQDIRFDVPLADACSKERTRLCDGVQPVGAPHPAVPGDCYLTADDNVDSTTNRP